MPRLQYTFNVERRNSYLVRMPSLRWVSWCSNGRVHPIDYIWNSPSVEPFQARYPDRDSQLWPILLAKKVSITYLRPYHALAWLHEQPYLLIKRMSNKVRIFYQVTFGTIRRNLWEFLMWKISGWWNLANLQHLTHNTTYSSLVYYIAFSRRGLVLL